MPDNKRQYVVDFDSGSKDPFTSIRTVEPDEDDKDKNPLDNQDDNPKPGDDKNPKPSQVDDDSDVDDTDDDNSPDVDDDDSSDDDNYDDSRDDSSDDDDDEGDEGDESRREPTDDEDDEDSLNPYYYLGNQLKTDGLLSEEDEIGEDISGAELYNRFRESLKKEIEPQVVQEAMNKLAEQGVTDRDILFARAIRQGVDPALLSEASAYEKYASIPEDADKESKIAVVRAMYQKRNFNENEISRMIETADAEDEIDDLFNQSKEFFGNKRDEFVQSEQQRAAEYQQRVQQQEQEVNKRVKSILSSKKLMGEEISENEANEIYNSIYNPTDVVEVQGQKYRATELQKFLLEFNNNPELKLYLFKKWKYKDMDRDKMKKKVKDEMEKDFLNAYGNKITKKVKKTKQPSNKKIKEKLEENKKTGNTFTIDLS